jgi:hypothetical protein
MAYSYPGAGTRPPLRCVRFLVGSPQRPRKQRVTPLRPSPLVVEGDNRPGLGHAIAKAIGDAGINISFVMAQVVGRRYSAVFGLENEADASKAATLIKRATSRGNK